MPGPAEAAEMAEVDADELDEVAQPDADGAPGGVDRGAVGDGDSEPDTTGAAAAPGRSTGRKPAVSRGRTPTPLTERVDDDGYLDCAANGMKFGRWCLQAMHRISDIASGDATLSLLQCLSVDATGPATLVYPTLQQVDFEVTRAGSDVVLWQWAYGAIFADERTEDDVSPGACRVYDVIWPEGRTDNNNRRIPEEGEYTLTARSFAAILGDENSATVTFTISNSQ